MTHELYKTKEDIETWLNQYNIENYELIQDQNYGYIVNVKNSLDLSENNIENIRVKFNIIEGDVDFSWNNLKSLNGSPEIVHGNFNCSNNQIETLKYSPKIIKGYFACVNNKLEELEHFPKKIESKCYLTNNSELGELQYLNDFKKLKKIHDSILLNKNLEKEITIDNHIKNVKIKL